MADRCKRTSPCRRIPAPAPSAPAGCHQRLVDCRRCHCPSRDAWRDMTFPDLPAGCAAPAWAVSPCRSMAVRVFVCSLLAVLPRISRKLPKYGPSVVSFQNSHLIKKTRWLLAPSVVLLGITHRQCLNGSSNSHKTVSALFLHLAAVIT